MLRPRFFYYLLFVLASWLISHIGRWAWLNLYFFFLLLLPLFSLLIALWQRRRIAISLLRARPYVERLETASWELNFTSHNRFYQQYVQTSYREQENSPEEYLDPLPLAAGESVKLIFEMPALHTGPLSPYNMKVKVSDPCKFFTLKLKAYNSEKIEPVWALPRSLIGLVDKTESEAYLETAERISKKSNHELDEIDLIRPMHRGDHRRDIHWKLSARMQDWMVRQYEKADENEINLLFNLPQISDKISSDHATLERRDILLDQVSEASQSFLSQDFHLCLSLYTPGREEFEAESLDYYQALRIRLADLPYKQAYSFPDMVMKELPHAKSKFYCIFTDELNREITTALLVLNAEVQGMLLRLVCQTTLPPVAWQEWIEELASAGIKISLARKASR